MEARNIQAVVDYIGKHLIVSYRVITNIAEDRFYDAKVTLTNSGNQDVTVDGGWSIFFFHLPRFRVDDEKDKMAWRNVDIGPVKIRHWQGNLYEMIPNPDFGTIAAGASKSIDFHNQRWCAARSDMWPNWYVTAPNAKPVTILSTASEDMEFFETLTKPEQLKRSKDDMFMPWTPEERFARNPRTVKSEQLLVPTPQESRVHSDEGMIIFDDHWSVCRSSKFTDSLELLAGKYK